MKTEFLFVYGTLMRRYRSPLMKDADYVGDCFAHGFALHNLGPFPGVVHEPGNTVRGELYRISTDMIPALDRYEGEGYLFRRERVNVTTMDGHSYSALIYVYSRSVTGLGKVCLDDQPWFERFEDKPDDQVKTDLETT